MGGATERGGARTGGGALGVPGVRSYSPWAMSKDWTVPHSRLGSTSRIAHRRGFRLFKFFQQTGLYGLQKRIKQCSQGLEIAELR